MEDVIGELRAASSAEAFCTVRRYPSPARLRPSPALRPDAPLEVALCVWSLVCFPCPVVVILVCKVSTRGFIQSRILRVPAPPSPGPPQKISNCDFRRVPSICARKGGAPGRRLGPESSQPPPSQLLGLANRELPINRLACATLAEAIPHSRLLRAGFFRPGLCASLDLTI